MTSEVRDLGTPLRRGPLGRVVALAASALAVRHVAGWPEMGSRYDAPAGTPLAQDPADMEDVDLWRAIDQGHDPTEHDH